MSKGLSKTPPLTLIISVDDVDAKGERADRVLGRLKQLPSRSQLKLWFSEGRIRRGLETLEPKAKVCAGDKITLMPRDPVIPILEPRKVSLAIHFEDEYLIVLYKPRGLSMHPGAGRRDETTLVHALLHHSKHLSDGSEAFRPGIVHRLDKETEGIVVVAKNNQVHEDLSRQFAERSIARRYWALAAGRPPKTMTIEGAIARHPVHRQKMHIHSRGREALTLVKTLKVFEEGYAWIECQLKTGRTHQIRVHLSSKGYPILNDPLYARPRKWTSLARHKQAALASIQGQALMAFELGFDHPVTHKRLEFRAEMPDWLKILTETPTD